MKILIAGGGTGGHFFSGVAVGEAFLARNEDNEVVYVGTRSGIEARVGPRDGLDVRFINVSGLKSKGLKARLLGLLRLPLAMLQSLKLLITERPKLVLGVGGFASGPLVLTAALLGRWTGVVEQNSVAGFTNRILGRFVHRVFLGFKEAEGAFPRKKIRFTGNPIREEVVNLLTLESTGTVGLGHQLRVLIVGGSQGARPLNENLPRARAHLNPELRERINIVHQTGKADEQQVREAYEGSGVTVEVLPFIEKMAEAYRDADLVICRAGALTCAELTISRRASLLVPFPQAADNHQETNARAIVNAGAGELLVQSEMTPEKLAEILMRLNEDRRALQKMAWSAGGLARPQAAAEVVDEMYSLMGIP